MRKLLLAVTFIAASALLSLSPPRAHAIVLTFDSPAGLFLGNNSINRPKLTDPTLPVYGDHATAAVVGSVTYPNAYNYGSTYGFTPNVGVAYGPGDPTQPVSSANPIPVFWTTNFGNLTNVMYQLDLANSVPNLTMSITLNADTGYKAQLYGFDLACWQNFPNNLDLLEVIVDGTPTVIGTNLAIANTASRTTFDFSASPFVGKTIQIFLDGRDTTPYGGSASQAYTNFTDIGIDNIAFAQVEIPEPVGTMLAGVGTLMLLAVRRRGK